MPYREISTITKEEIENVCKETRCFRQANAMLKIHLLNINQLVERVKQEKIDVSHFNKGDINCKKCGKPYKISMVLDFDDVGRKIGDCSECKHNEWIEDGGDIIDSMHYFTEGYKTNQVLVVGHTEI